MNIVIVVPCPLDLGFVVALTGHQLGPQVNAPVIARKAYFTATMFGLSSNNKLDGREKKKSVDHCSKWIRYYISRICGIASEIGVDGKQVLGDSMLSLVASIHLNE